MRNTVRIDTLPVFSTFMLTDDERTIYNIVHFDDQGDVDCVEFMRSPEYVRCSPRKVCFFRALQVIEVPLIPKLPEPRPPLTLRDLKQGDTCILLERAGIMWRVDKRYSDDESDDVKCIQVMSLNQAGVWQFVHNSFEYFELCSEVARTQVSVTITSP